MLEKILMALAPFLEKEWESVGQPLLQSMIDKMSDEHVKIVLTAELHALDEIAKAEAALLAEPKV